MIRAALRPSAAAAGVAVFLALSSAQALVPVAWICLVLVAAWLAWRGAIDLDRPLDAIELAAAAWLVAMLLAALFGMAPRQSLLTSVPILSTLIVWCLLTRTATRPIDARWIAGGFFLSALSQTAMVSLQIALDPTATPATWITASATPWLVVPNDITWFALCLPLIAVSGGRHERLIGTLLLVLFLAACVLLQSRTAGIVAIASFVAFYWFSRGKARLSWNVLVPRAVVALAVLPLLVLYVPSFTARWQLWQAAMHIFAQHPLLGVGPHNFAADAQPWLLSLPDRVDARVAPWPHNLLLELAAETGLAGMACAGWLGFALFRRLRASRAGEWHRIHYAAFAGLGGLAIAGLVEASFLRLWVWNVGVMLCGLALVPSRPWSSLPAFSDKGDTRPGIQS